MTGRAVTPHSFQSWRDGHSKTLTNYERKCMPTVDSWDTISKAAASIHLNHLPWKQSFLLLSHFHTYLFIFFFFYSGGHIGKPWSCCLPFLPYHRWLPHINPKLCKYKGQWLPTNSTVYQLCNSWNHTSTAVVRVPQSYGCVVEEKKSVLYPVLSGF